MRKVTPFKQIRNQMETTKTKAIRAHLDTFMHTPAYSEIFKHIQPYSDIFRHDQAYRGNIQTHSGIFRALCKPEIFRTLVYSEPLAYSKPEACSEPEQTSMMERFAKKVNDYNYIRNLCFSLSLLYEINIMVFFNAGLFFAPEVIILCKKRMVPGALNFFY